MIKKLFALILSVSLLLALAVGCGTGSEPADQPSDPPAEDTDNKGNDKTPDDPNTPDDPDSKTPSQPFTFQAKLSSPYMVEIFGETMVQAWYNLVDAVLAGESTFACPDENTYDWIMGQFPDRYFPVFHALIEKSYSDTAVADGVASFRYKVSPEECAAMLADFETLVTNLLNETMKPEYTDMEKALALYCYFSSHYTYDNETFEKQNREGYVDYVSSYRFLTTDTGICTECARAYSYLLMQVGVDATTMMGSAHEWSYIRINGNNYHIDPTFAMGENNALQYFMMSDADREADFSPETFVICSNYTQEYPHPEYVANDEFFDQIHSGYLEDFDHDTHIMHTYGYNRDHVRIDVDFDYTGF